ncbi:hypothetical protein CRUP_016178 [Coryphaenoides rupestris]|nr:hypothetical protein CRUP_016178 [Coryphaenoides rupestris]
MTRNLTSLKTLTLEGNQLTRNFLDDAAVSPSAFAALESVGELRLDGNRLRSVPRDLPTSVQVLGVSNNLIEEVTKETLSASLESLDLSHNHLALIPAGLPRSLQNLSILHNALSHIPAFSFRHLRPGLRSLRLSHNALGDAGVSHVAFVGTYRSLTELHLDHNGLTAVPRIVRQFKKLQDLRLDGNHIRTVKKWALCPPRNAGSSLSSLRLENNLLENNLRLPAGAFSCLPDPRGLVLLPQRSRAEGDILRRLKMKAEGGEEGGRGGAGVEEKEEEEEEEEIRKGKTSRRR